MSNTVLKTLTPIRRRMRLNNIIRSVGVFALAGGFCVLLCGLVRLLFIANTSVSMALGIFLACCAIGVVIGWWHRMSWHDAAEAVDRYYQLKDRTTTALQFSEQPDPSSIQQLQLADAQTQLANVQPDLVVPLSHPGHWLITVACLLIGARLLMMPLINGGELQPLRPSDQLATAAIVELTKQIDQLDELAQASAEEDLKQLVSQLRQDLKQMKLPAVTVHDSLKTVSEMQQKMKRMAQELNVAAMDSQLLEVGKAIAGAKPFESTAEALKNDNPAKAADKLAELTAEEVEAMKRAESQPTAEKLAEAANAAKKEGMEDLAKQLNDLSEAVKSGDGKQAKESAKDLAETMDRQAARKQLNQLLVSKAEQLGQTKQKLAVQSQSEGDGAMAGKGQNLKEGKAKAATADIASQKAGAKLAGNINGQKTQLESQRQIAKLTGQLGEEGDSDKETISTLETPEQQQLQQEVTDTFTKYEKMSDAVLDSEPIPAGHRRTIRNYFELIRPVTEPSP